MADSASDNQNNRFNQYLQKYGELRAVIESPKVCGRNKALIGLAIVAFPTIALARSGAPPYLLALAALLAVLICWNARKPPKVPP